jgi:broad specificity phosphatase PhoE
VILFVRHGETAANRARLALGRADPPLTDLGREQAAALADRLVTSDAVRIVASPLLRAVQTAAVIADGLGVPVETDDRLVEMDYGEWDQRSFGELPADELARWYRDAAYTPPGGESLLTVGARVADLCAELLDGSTVVAVSHVSPIKAAALWSMGGDPLLAWRMHLDVASITRIGARNGRSFLLGFNDTAHLG